MYPLCSGSCPSESELPGETCKGCSEVESGREEMRRYLYRNVACEYRKGFADFSKMPDLPGWA